MTDAANQPVWQWGYSAFGDNEPSIAARNFRDRSWRFAKGELSDLADGSDDVDNNAQFGQQMVKLNVRGYLQRKAEQDAWLRDFMHKNNEWGQYGDGFSTLTGGGIAGHHPSVPNSLETLLDPRREGPYVPDVIGRTCRAMSKDR